MLRKTKGVSNLKSIADNIIYLYIEKNNKNLIIGAIKIKKGKKSIYSKTISGTEDNEIKLLVDFLENMEVIVYNADFIKKIINDYNLKINNKLLDLREFCAIIEPYRVDYEIDYLINSTTTIVLDTKNESILDKVNNLIIVMNSMLVRQWSREDSNEKNKSLYNELNTYYNLLDLWPFTKYLEKPLFFDYSKYNYILLEDKKEKCSKNNKKINYSKFEELLKDEEIWNKGSNFNYSYREDQLKLSKKIRENFESEEKLFIEAPTGSGKTFAYLLIVVLEAYKNMNKNPRGDASFVISTDTKELQNQIIEKDIPNVLEKLNLRDKIKYGSMKGKANYICTDKLRLYKEKSFDLKSTLSEIFLKRLCEDGEYGDIENISHFAMEHFNLDEILKEVVCNNEECNLDKCNRLCYLRKRYLELPFENITVINHSLLASWPYSEKKQITHLIIDEAHNLMDKCYDFFKEEFNTFEFRKLLSMIFEKEPTIIRYLKNLNSANGYKEIIDEDKIKYWIHEIINSIELLLNKGRELKLVQGEYNFKAEYNLCEEHIKSKIKLLEVYISKVKENIYGLYSLINRYFRNITSDGEDGKDNKEFSAINSYIIKLKGNYDCIDNFIEKNSKSYAKIIEITNDYSDYTITNIPLNIDELFNEIILKDVKSTVFLSATMRINNSFNRIKKFLGQENAKEFVHPPTFNLKEQTRIFTIKDIGSYYSEDFSKNSAQFIYNLAQKLNGHILVLFNNVNRLKKVQDNLNELCINSKFEIYNTKKAIRFLKNKNKQVIILGSKSFFEGIDIQGDGLSAVILDKIPNKSLNDPLLKAVVNYENKNYEYINYPQLVIKVKQIYGRLIRSSLDSGYFCILDGGNNNKTLKKLEYDLKGPVIESISSRKLLSICERDYRKWKVKNLNYILKKTYNGSSININDFINESKKNNLFWDIKEYEDKYEFQNLKYKYIITKRK